MRSLLLHFAIGLEICRVFRDENYKMMRLRVQRYDRSDSIASGGLSRKPAHTVPLAGLIQASPYAAAILDLSVHDEERRLLGLIAYSDHVSCALVSSDLPPLFAYRSCCYLSPHPLPQ